MFPATDPRWTYVTDIADLPAFLLEEIGHFFDVYKQLEPGKDTTTRGWEGVAAAEQAVRDAQAAHPVR